MPPKMCMPAHVQAELRSRIIGSSAGEETSEDYRENGRSWKQMLCSRLCRDDFSYPFHRK